MPVNTNVEDLAAKLLNLVKPEVKDDPRMLHATTIAVHIGANIVMDIKRCADALEKIANGIESIDRS